MSGIRSSAHSGPIARKPFLIGGAATTLLIAVLALPEPHAGRASVEMDPAGEAQQIYQTFVEKVTQSSRVPATSARSVQSLPPLARDLFNRDESPTETPAPTSSDDGDPDLEREPALRYRGTYRDAGRRFVFLGDRSIAVGDSIGTQWVVDADPTHVTLWNATDGYSRIERSPVR